LPDGKFSNQKYYLELILGLGMEKVGYITFMPIWNTLRPFGIFYGHLVIWWQFGTFFHVLVYVLWQDESGNPDSDVARREGVGNLYCIS
jgi:hypothetical protein